ESLIISLSSPSNFESALSASCRLHRKDRATAQSHSSADISTDPRPEHGFRPPLVIRLPPKASEDIRRYYFAPSRRQCTRPREWPRAECRLSSRSSRSAEASRSACNTPRSNPSLSAKRAGHGSSLFCSLIAYDLLENSKIGKEN